MTETQTSSLPPHVPPPPPSPPQAPVPEYRTRGWVKAVLALSLAANLAVAGLAVGAYVKNGGPPPRHDEMGLGPLGDALNAEDRRALRAAFLAEFPDLKRGRAAVQADFAALVTALRAEPFDANALEQAIQVIADRNAARLSTIRAILTRYLETLDPAARAAFADRLEKALDHAARKAEGRHGDRDKGDDKRKPGHKDDKAPGTTDQDDD